MILLIIIFINFFVCLRAKSYLYRGTCILKTQVNFDTVHETQLILLAKRGKEFEQAQFIVKTRDYDLQKLFNENDYLVTSCCQDEAIQVIQDFILEKR